jgi:membrane-associated phospholipid phosphatase
VYRRSAPLVAAFAALAALVAAGAFTGIDQWSVDHLMPGARFHGTSSSPLEGAVPLLGASWHGGLGTAANIVTLPASLVVSLAIVGWRSRLLAAALLAATAVEVVCKELLARPALYAGTFHIEAFDSSFPSGHALRTVLVAVALWPHRRAPVALWAAASLVLLVLGAWHTPTDVAGGVLLGLLGARAAGALRARRLARP